MIIALASPRVADSVDEGLDRVDRLLAEAAAQQAQIVCFPEAYIPGLRGMDFYVPAFDKNEQARVLRTVSQSCRNHGIATILGTELLTEKGRHIAAVVIDAAGEIKGYQTKNQLDPTEDRSYVPGSTREIFEIDGLRFGIAICHEGFRYPETVRWAAMRGASVVFHPHCTGSDKTGTKLTKWGAAESPYYEKAMMCRALENTIFFASSNYAFRYQESATCLINPAGECQAYLSYGTEGVLVQSVDVDAATGLLASRFEPARYPETPPRIGRITESNVTTPAIGRYVELAPAFRLYDPQSPLVAASLISAMESIDARVKVEHIGSSSVPGCGGKGYIDLLVTYPEGELEAAKQVLATLGFQHQSNRDPFPESRPMRIAGVTHNGTVYPIHAHVVCASTNEVDDLLSFRNRLRSDESLVRAYEAEKKRILSEGVVDGVDYAERKGTFVQGVLGSRSAESAVHD
jgi:predicted amidohydrolase/GrpB-like predicted nucleotidyltransferase (UPF0157 family)